MEAVEPPDLPSFTSLPAEVIFNILIKLSARTLLRFRCVCKDWNSIITSQSFINTHLLSQPHGHLFCHYFRPSLPSSSTYEKAQLCSFFPDESFSLVHKFKVPLPYCSQQEPSRNVVGSMNGLLCLTDSDPFGYKVYLWNPTIRKYKTLSNTSFKGKHRRRYFHPETDIELGFGFCARTSDYIIIRIALFEWRSRRLKSHPLPQAEAYSLSTNSWKNVGFSEDVSRRLRKILSWKYVHMNGDLNWIATFSDGEGRPYESILSFDVNKEEFREIRMPRDCRNEIDGTSWFSRIIAIHRGLLAIVITDTLIPEDGNWYVCLWTMEDYGKVDSWRRTTVKTTTGQRSVLGCTLDGRIMFRKGGGMETIVQLLDMETLQEQQFSIRDFEFMHEFKETLVYPQEANVSSENVLSK